MTDVSGRTVVVTGAAAGIGREIVRRFHADGANVVIADIDDAGAEALASELSPAGERTRFVHLDVRNEREFEAALEAARGEWGKVDVLVNNAAKTQAKSPWEITSDEWDDVLATNARGVFFGSRVFGRHMADQGYGRIVNLTSLSGQWGKSLNGAHYTASKGAIISLTRVFAQQLAPSGVTVNAVAPAATDGPNARAMPPESIRAYLEANVPVGRLGQPREIADLVLFLGSERSAYITGATIDINGGANMR